VGTSRITTLAFAPPKPKEFTIAVRGAPPLTGQVRSAVTTCRPRASKSIAGFGVVKWRLGGSSP
jgi:hypothetical protein